MSRAYERIKEVWQAYWTRLVQVSGLPKDYPRQGMEGSEFNLEIS